MGKAKQTEKNKVGNATAVATEVTKETALGLFAKRATTLPAETAGIDQVHGIVANVGIAVEGLRIIVPAAERVGGHEAAEAGIVGARKGVVVGRFRGGPVNRVFVVFGGGIRVNALLCVCGAIRSVATIPCHLQSGP